jgi:hypothetical protein
MNETTKAVVIAVTASAAAAVTTALITHYLTKQATIQNIATGKQPLPAGSTPTTETPKLAPVGGSSTSIAPGVPLKAVQTSGAYAPPNQQDQNALLQQAVALSTAIATRT